MRILNFLKTNNDKQKSIRIKTEIGDKFLNVNLDQTYESLDILSLKIFQKDVYRLFDAEYGIIVGRVLGQGVGIPNCRISVFIPIDEEITPTPTTLEDIKKIEAVALYPYTSVYDKDIEGKVYNLLPKYSKNRNFNGFPDNQYGIGATPKTPVGNFPEKEEVLVNETVAYVYDKYYKYTTITNESGDYILVVPSNRTFTVNVSCDITDIGKFSTIPGLLKLQGYPDNFFNQDGTLINEDLPLESLPNIEIQNIPITVKPLWSQNLENTNVGINRLDFTLNKKIQPFTTVVGNYFTQNKSNWWGDRIIFRALIGLRSLCLNIFGNCQPINSSKWIVIWFALQIKVCVFGNTILNIDWKTNTDVGVLDCNDFRLCLGIKVKYIIPFFNFVFFQTKYCTLRGGKTQYEPWDLRLELSDECTRERALSKLGGDITDGLFLDKHDKGKVDIKIFSIKNTVTDEECNILNNITTNNAAFIDNYSVDSDIELLSDNKHVKYINDGNFVALLETNRKKVITNENGDLVEVPYDNKLGVFTEFRGYFIMTHLDETDNPPTRNRTAKIRLKIPQFFDYNENPITWIWKHFIFNFGEIYSVAQYNKVRYAEKDQNWESTDDDMLKPKTDKGWDEQTNILFTGAFTQEDNLNVPYTTIKNNADVDYTSFYNHITYLGIDASIEGLNNGEYNSDAQGPTPQPPLNRPINIILYTYGETTFVYENQKSGWNMFDNNLLNGNTVKPMKVRINLTLPAEYDVPTENDIWSFGIKAISNDQINRMIFNSTPFDGPNVNYLFNIDNLAPTYQFVSGTDGVIFKFFDIIIPNGNVFYFWKYHELISYDNRSDFTQWTLETVLSNGYNNSSYQTVSIGTLNRPSGHNQYLNPPY